MEDTPINSEDALLQGSTAEHSVYPGLISEDTLMDFGIDSISEEQEPAQEETLPRPEETVPGDGDLSPAIMELVTEDDVKVFAKKMERYLEHTEEQLVWNDEKDEFLTLDGRPIPSPEGGNELIAQEVKKKLIPISERFWRQFAPKRETNGYCYKIGSFTKQFPLADKNEHGEFPQSPYPTQIRRSEKDTGLKPVGARYDDAFSKWLCVTCCGHCRIRLNGPVSDPDSYDRCITCGRLYNWVYGTDSNRRGDEITGLMVADDEAEARWWICLLCNGVRDVPGEGLFAFIAVNSIKRKKCVDCEHPNNPAHRIAIV